MAVPPKLIAYVTNANDNNNLLKVGSVIPVDLEARTPLKPIRIFGRSKSNGSGTNAIIVTADGKTAFVSNEFANTPTGTVSKIDLASGKVRWSITVGQEPVDIEFVPNSGEEWAWVANLGDQSITTVNLVRGEVGTTIKVLGQQPNTVAFSPDGSVCYVANWLTDNPAGSSVTPIKVTDNGASGTVLPSFLVGLHPNSVAFTKDGTTAYVVNKGSKSLTPVDVATNTPEAPIAMPGQPILIGVSPDGTLAYVMIADDTTDAVVRLDLTTKPATVGAPIQLVKGCQPHWVAFTPDGTTAYIVGNGNSTLTPITVAGDVLGQPFFVSTDPAADILDIAIVEVD
jgi:DNA-binding beta-propeller fold protein YncE